MKALLVPEKGRLELGEIVPPVPGPYDALVRMECCGICNSTDAKLIDGTMFWAPPFPFVLGHESVGTVIEIGPKVRTFKLGDQVTRPLAFWPGTRTGLHVAMGGFSERGVVRDGRAMAGDGDASLANDYNVQRQNVVPEGLSARDAALAISLSECASVLRHLPPLAGKRVVIAGTGIAGLAFTLWCKRAGAFVVTLGRRDERLEAAKTVGADVAVNTSGADWVGQVLRATVGPADGLIEATGDARLAEQMLALLHEDGFASAYGVPPTGTAYDGRWKKSVVEEHLSFGEVAGLLARGVVKPEWFVSHEWDMGEVVAAFDQVRRGEIIKGFVRLA